VVRLLQIVKDLMQAIVLEQLDSSPHGCLTTATGCQPAILGLDGSQSTSYNHIFAEPKVYFEK
jgi:hypothetical protein